MQTLRIGRIEFSQREVITFAKGLCGCPELTRFVILPSESEFRWMQSVDDAEIAIQVVDPNIIVENFVTNLAQSDDMILVMCTIGLGQKTANLRAPLFINVKNKTGRHVILTTTNYTTRHTIPEKKPPMQIINYRGGYIWENIVTGVVCARMNDKAYIVECKSILSAKRLITKYVKKLAASKETANIGV